MKASILFFLFLLSTIAYAGSTQRELTDARQHIVDEEYHKTVGAHYGRFAVEAKFEKEKWQNRKDNANNCLWKKFCGSLVKHHERIEEANDKVSEMHLDKSREASDKLDKFRKEYRAHTRLLQQVEQRSPKVNGIRRTKSFSREPAKANGHRRSKSFSG